MSHFLLSFLFGMFGGLAVLGLRALRRCIAERRWRRALLAVDLGGSDEILRRVYTPEEIESRLLNRRHPVLALLKREEPPS